MKRIHALAHWCHWRMLKISWKDGCAENGGPEIGGLEKGQIIPKVTRRKMEDRIWGEVRRRKMEDQIWGEGRRRKMEDHYCTIDIDRIYR